MSVPVRCLCLSRGARQFEPPQVWCRSIPTASPGSVERAMRTLGLQGIRRAKGVGTTIPARDGRRAGDLLDRDFALMECVNGLFKTECIRTTVFHDGPFKTIADVEYATAGWVDWYNQRRLHSSLGYVSPAEYEATHYATLTREPQPV